MRHGRCAFREEEGFDSNMLLFFLSTRGHMDWTHEWEELHPDKTPPHSPATAAHRARERDTWDIPARGPPFHLALRRGCPSCGSHERGRSLGRPRAASRQRCPSFACWGRRGCWNPRDTGDEQHSALAAAPPGVWLWGYGKDPQQYATRELLHRDRLKSRPPTPESHYPPTERKIPKE